MSLCFLMGKPFEVIKCCFELRLKIPVCVVQQVSAEHVTLLGNVLH